MKKSRTIILSIINIISSFLLVSVAFLTKILIDYVTSSTSIETNQLIIYAASLLGVVLLQIGLRTLYSFIRSKYLLYLDVFYKQKIHNALLNKEITELNKYHSGELTNIYLSDIRNLEEALANVIPSAAGSLSRFLFSLIALIIIDWKFLILLIGIGIIAATVGYFYSKKMKVLAKKALKSDGQVNSLMQESLENIKIVKAFEVEDNVASSLKTRLDDNYKIKKKKNLLAIIGFTGIYGLMNFSYAICLVYGAYSIAFLSLSYGSLSALLQLVNYLEGPLGDFSAYLNAYANYKASKERIGELLSLKEENQDGPSLQDFDEIVFDNISFQYEEGKPVISDFSLRIKKEDVVLFKGESGRGKTTLFMLLLGFLKPNKGEIYVLYNGHKTLIGKETRNLFSYVPQDNIIFSGTIRDNFALLASEKDETKIYEALEKACLKEDVLHMPLKLDTLLKERGQGLSTGQIQRILIAISLLKNKNILLLDEFTSSLDAKTEEDVVISLAHLNKTIIGISHRKILLEKVEEINI